MWISTDLTSIGIYLAELDEAFSVYWLFSVKFFNTILFVYGEGLDSIGTIF